MAINSKNRWRDVVGAIALLPSFIFFSACCKELPSEGRQAIQFGVSGCLAPASRSVQECDISSLEMDGFRVCAALDGSSDIYFDDVASKAENAYTTQAVHYFPYGRNLDFYAVHPLSYGFETEEDGFCLEYGWTGTTDLVAAVASDVAQNQSPVTLTFRHILSQLSIRCRGIDPSVEYRLTGINVYSPSSGKYSLPSNEWSRDVNTAHSVLETELDISSGEALPAGQTFSYIPGLSEIEVSWQCLQSGVLAGTYTNSIALELEQGCRHTVILNLPANGLEPVVWSVAVNDWLDEFNQYMAGKAATLRIDDAAGLFELPPLAIPSGAGVVIDWGDGKMERFTADGIAPTHEYSGGGAKEVTFYVSGGKVEINLGELYRHTPVPYIVTDSSRFAVNYDRIPEPLTFSCEGPASLAFTTMYVPAPHLQYSYDKALWNEWDYSALEFGNGVEVFIRGVDNATMGLEYEYSTFELSGEGVRCKGDIMCLLDYSELDRPMTPFCFSALFSFQESLIEGPELPATELSEGCYYRLFEGTSLKEAPDLPADEMAVRCYAQMFNGCNLSRTPVLKSVKLAPYCYTSMFSCCNLPEMPQLPATKLEYACYEQMFTYSSCVVVAPELPAEELAPWCYDRMFEGCTNLTSAPGLPAKVLDECCYQYMFKGCSSLEYAPDLPVETLAKGCYCCMFYDCSSLKAAPALPATEMKENCYRYMFKGCTSLEESPVLPAVTLVKNCYMNMFDGCTKLKKVTALFTTKPSTTYTKSWLNGVSETGTFVRSPDATWKVTGVNGVPSGWEIIVVGE